MNHAQLEAIRRRVENTSETRPEHPAVTDREQLLAELDRKWRALERANETIRQVREFASDMEDDATLDESDWFADKLRTIVGPR